ncbi:MAG TPA: molybdenum cofactor guanylyltransferase [Terriglobales bacterium]|nr:molybdenum cofactor guanylyltransferase [Terriglobales bacterium]
MSDIAAFVLAGGRSTRMGTDKAFLGLGGVTLLGRALNLARSVVPRTCIIGDKEKFQNFGEVIEDVHKECGPLGGIHAALVNTTTDFNFILGVDLPFVKKAFVEYLFYRAHKTSAIVTVPRAESRLQPLCAVYRKEFADIAQRSLHSGHNKIDPLFAEVQTEIVSEEELALQRFPASMFRNLNTPADWEQAKLDGKFG